MARFLTKAGWIVFLLLLQAGLLHSADSYFTVATFNAEWLGYPANSHTWNRTRTAQIEAAAGEILATEADLVALQEVVTDDLNGDALADLVIALNAQDPGETWAGAYNPKFSFWWDPDFASYPAQRQAFVWKASSVEFISAEAMLDWIQPWDALFASGRLPFLLRARVGPAPFQQEVYFICLHLKCCTGYDYRRLASMTVLLDELHANYADVPLFVLGDFNVADRAGAFGEITEWGFYEDDNGDGSPDFIHASGFLTAIWGSIDHIMISDELVSSYSSVPVDLQQGWSTSSVSDHNMFIARLDLVPSPADQYEQWRQEQVGAHPGFAALSAYEDDPDHDSRVNYLEFLLGSSPVAGDPAAGSLAIQATGSGDLELSYRRRMSIPESAIAVTYRDGLDTGGSWSALGEAHPIVTKPDPLPGFERITILFTAPQGQEFRAFRLEAPLPD